MRFEDIDSVDLHLDLAGLSLNRQEVNIRLTEDHEQVAFAGIFQILGHVQVSVHAGFEDGDAAQFVELRRVSFVVEGTRDEDVKICIGTFTSGFDQIGALNGAELGADEDACSAFNACPLVSCF